MTLEFSGDVYFWKGPAPWYFVKIPEKQSRELKEVMAEVSYGWGMIPVKARIGRTDWTTSLWPKDGLYILPIKANVRKAENVEDGDSISAQIEII